MGRSLVNFQDFVVASVMSSNYILDSIEMLVVMAVLCDKMDLISPGVLFLVLVHPNFCNFWVIEVPWFHFGLNLVLNFFVMLVGLFIVNLYNNECHLINY